MMPNKSLIRFILAILLLALTACASTVRLAYEPSTNGSTGYFERQKSTNKWMVGFYFNVYNQLPQQAANIIMRHAAEKADQEGAKWIRILHYDTEKHRGPIASLPALDDLESGRLIRGMYFYGNQDAAITDSQIRQGVNYALVEYFEFAHEIDCQAQKCGTVEFFIEDCGGGRDNGTQKIASMCNEIPDTDIENSPESCTEHVQYLSKEICNTVKNASRSPRGMIEERDPLATGAWYKTADVLKKYLQRTEPPASRK
ncbi:MAG: hypothetical protein HY016_07010 [Nitrosomonadales bacterium]|nr:hypothetical protein [Nitrosomonadales bacterium]